MSWPYDDVASHHAFSKAIPDRPHIDNIQWRFGCQYVMRNEGWGEVKRKRRRRGEVEDRQATAAIYKEGIKLFLSPDISKQLGHLILSLVVAMLSLSLLTLAGLAASTIVITDPSDVISPSDWAADDALLADYNVDFVSGLILLSTQPSHPFQDISPRHCKYCTKHMDRSQCDKKSQNLLRGQE